ncbi:MAG: acyltransferase [Muribaculaceae bacterium]|nr:acyltransferase [Muribaculaceae bacterium]
MEKRKRIDVPDIMKGLGIILVVVKHCQLWPDPDTSVLARVWSCMAMPMFFFVTGLFLPIKRPLKQVLVNNTRHLLLPWVVFSIGAGVTLMLIEGKTLHGVWDIHYWLFVWPNAPLYFLRALFMAIAVAWIAAKLCRTLVAQAGMMLVFMAVSWAIVTFDPRWAVFYSWREAASMIMYMWAGHMIASFSEVERLTLPRRVAFDVMFLALAVACLINPARMRWHFQETQNSWFVLTACAILGVIAIWALACVLKGVRPLAHVGRVSMSILVTHYWLLIVFVTLLACSRPVAAVPTLALLPMAVWVCERYLPFLVGKHKQRDKQK